MGTFHGRHLQDDGALGHPTSEQTSLHQDGIMSPAECCPKQLLCWTLPYKPAPRDEDLVPPTSRETPLESE